MDDGAYLDNVADHLAMLPGVRAVTLGGSRAAGTNRPDSDWDFGIYYRGHLDTIDQELTGTRAGRFSIEPLMFHLAGIPSYLVLAELAVSRVIRGELPRPDYPAALREAGLRVWWGRAERTFDYARAGHAPYGRLAQCAGLVVQAACQSAHAVLAARAQWVTNDKALLTRAGLSEVDEFVAAARPDPDSLRDLVDRSSDLCSRTLRAAHGS